MARIAEKVLPLMTPEEVRQIVIDHYRSESQNLTTAAEANLLKFYEMEGLLGDAGSRSRRSSTSASSSAGPARTTPSPASSPR